MRGLIRFAGILPTAAAGAGAAILAGWSIGAPEPDTFPQGDAERGAYLARASGCVSCHTNAAAQGAALAGGAPLDTPFGTFVPPNIAPHTTAGIGSWSIQDLAKAVRQGISPDGAPYYPVFTYSFYAGFTEQDIADLWEAFRTVPPVADAAPSHDVGFPFSFCSGLKLWRAAYLDAPTTDALMGTSSPWNRGRLLVEGTAHCSACHTGRTLFGGLEDDDRFAGNDSLPGGSKAPSILAADLVAGGLDRREPGLFVAVGGAAQWRRLWRQHGRGRGRGHLVPDRHRPSGRCDLPARPRGHGRDSDTRSASGHRARGPFENGHDK
jgi:mono/diheme cytochrome c family protein